MAYGNEVMDVAFAANAGEARLKHKEIAAIGLNIDDNRIVFLV